MLTSSVTMLTGILSLYLFGSFMMENMKSHASGIFSGLADFEMTERNVYVLSVKLFILIVILLAPIITSIIISSIFISMAQENGKLDISWERLSFDPAKLNPLSGIGRLFNKDALVEMLKSLLKLLVVGYIAYRIMRDEVQNITFLSGADIGAILEYVGHISFKIVTHTCGIMIVLGILDMMYVKWRYIENLKMTKQEVKDEFKESEGNPEIKGKIKQLQFQMARRRMIKIIPTADVVITNPTHYAVALKYDRDRMAAPFVIAKGVDVMAQAIKKIAQENKITLVENRFLARELYDQVDENEEIPESLYSAVAEVLAYVYKLKGKV